MDIYTPCKSHSLHHHNSVIHYENLIISDLPKQLDGTKRALRSVSKKINHILAQRKLKFLESALIFHEQFEASKITFQGRPLSLNLKVFYEEKPDEFATIISRFMAAKDISYLTGNKTPSELFDIFTGLFTDPEKDEATRFTKDPSKHFMQVPIEAIARLTYDELKTAKQALKREKKQSKAYKEKLNEYNTMKKNRKKDKDQTVKLEKSINGKSLSDNCLCYYTSYDYEYLPRNVGLLKNISMLCFPGVSLYEVPDELSKLSKISYMDLSGNNLRRLPESFSLLINLYYLNLGNNKLIVIPPVLLKIKQLGDLELTGNPLLKGQVEDFKSEYERRNSKTIKAHY